MNNTYNNIINQIKGSKTWFKVKDDLSKISLSKTVFGNYAIYYENIFTGLFIAKNSVSEKEVKECKWKVI